MGIPGVKVRRRRAVALSGQDAAVVDRLARRSHDEHGEGPTGEVTVLSRTNRWAVNGRRERPKGR